MKDRGQWRTGYYLEDTERKRTERKRWDVCEEGTERDSRSDMASSIR